MGTVSDPVPVTGLAVSASLRAAMQSSRGRRRRSCNGDTGVPLVVRLLPMVENCNSALQREHRELSSRDHALSDSEKSNAG
jgi:hypothetical protein